MADIVEDMRGGLPCTEAGNPCTVMDAAIGCFCAKAADEIERLRAALEEIVGLGAICASDIAAITLLKSRARAALEDKS